MINCKYCWDSDLGPGRMTDIDGTPRPCCCWPQRVAEWAVTTANISKRDFSSKFSIFVPNDLYPNHKDVFDYCVDYAKSWLTTVKPQGRCLTLLGPECGMGKSYLAAAICHHLIENYWTKTTDTGVQDVCLFIGVGTWFEGWRDLYMRYPTDERYGNQGFIAEQEPLGIREARMKTTELLVLEDLTKFDLERKHLVKLNNVIEHRIANRLPIIITDGADSPTQLSDILGPEFGPQIVSRISNAGDVLVIEEHKAAPKPKSKSKGSKKS